MSNYQKWLNGLYSVKRISDDAGSYGPKASDRECRLIERVSDASRKLLDGFEVPDEPFAELSGAYLKILDDAAGDYGSQLEWLAQGVMPKGAPGFYKPALQIANATESILEPQILEKILGKIKKGMNARNLKAELRKHPYPDDSIFYAKKGAGVS